MSIYIKLSGGLGNQLFQYALGRSLAIKNCCPLYLDTTWFNNIPDGSTHRDILLKNLNIEANFIDSEGSCEKIIKNRNWFNFFHKNLKTEQTHYRYESKISKVRLPIYLNGYWQSYKYFEHFRHQLLKELTPKVSPNDVYINYKHLIQREKNPIAVHIRRGDYITSESASKIHGTLPISYYQNGINELQKRSPKQNFFFFSDDIQWVKKQFLKQKNFHYIEPADQQESAVQELHLMSLCKDYIIANSSLSWWGAWLGTHPEKIVIAPNKWTANLDCESIDLIPQEWILLS